MDKPFLLSVAPQYIQPLTRGLLFHNNSGDDLTTVNSLVTCSDPAYSSPLLDCNGCTGSYLIPVSCEVCSVGSTALSLCTTCPKGSWGGGSISCTLCPIGYATIAPSTTSISDCVPITHPPTSAPTVFPTTIPTQPPSVKPSTLNPSRARTSTPTRPGFNPGDLPTSQPTFVKPTLPTSLKPTFKRT